MASTNQNKTSFWNSEISKPVTCSLAIFPSWTQCELLNRARRVLSECTQCLSQQQQLSAEYFVLNRLVYMKHGQLRREKSYQGLKQIRTCVRKFFALGLEKSVKEMSSYLEDSVVQEGIRVYLPSQQMWQHLLTQLLAAAALLTNTASRCAAVFLHVHRHLAAGMLIPTNMVFLSLLGRIWACCQGLCLEIQTWYQLLAPVTDVLTPTEVAWLPEGESLPTDLLVWLKEQGFSCGLSYLNREGGDDDTLASLMARYQLPEREEKDQEEEVDNGEEERTEPSADHTLPGMMDEDLGDPVDVSRIMMGSEAEGPSLLHNSAVPARGKTGLKERIRTAATILDLQRIFKKFKKNFPGASTNSKSHKCSQRLAELQAKSQVLENEGRLEEVQNLFARGRKKLILFLKSVMSKSNSEGQTGSGEERCSSTKNPKRKNKVKKTVARKKKSDMASANGGEKGSRLKKSVKNHTGTEAVKKTKKKKSRKGAGAEKGRKNQLRGTSAGHHEQLGGRKGKKNDPAYNGRRAALAKQKKKQARKV